jgi:hypothetical protein
VADQTLTPLPPDQPTVIARCLCLGTLIIRGSLERAMQLTDDPDHAVAFRELALRMSRWLNEQDFTANFTLEELAALSESAGAWTQARLVLQEGASESLGVLLWALSVHQDIPPYDEPFGLPNLESLLGFPASALLDPRDERLQAFPRIGWEWLKQVAQLRPQPVILEQRAAAECWQWRAHVASLQRAGVPPPEGQEYAVMIAIAAEEAHAAGVIPAPVDRDFPLFGKAYAALSDDELAEATALANARRIGLDWLCGYATAWDNVPVATA